jgi:hypothetical protein
METMKRYASALPPHVRDVDHHISLGLHDGQHPAIDLGDRRLIRSYGERAQVLLPLAVLLDFQVLIVLALVATAALVQPLPVEQIRIRGTREALSN